MLARYGSWGAVPEVFDLRKDNWDAERGQLLQLLDAEAYDAAAQTTINAHFTDPAYVREIWAGLERLGFEGGRVLEPGAGAGTFIGLAPASAEMIGVEIDPTTAAIATALYPHADIRAESFVDTNLRGQLVDAVVGNVPFANVQLHDPVHNPDRRHSMHNHFILKSLALTRPGGIVAVLSSSFTLDAGNPGARREMNKLADLVGAVRLPTGAHKRAAGTEVVTDLLIFRRREADAPPRDRTWETVTARQVDGETVHLNSYFDTRPENILGDVHASHGMHGSATLHITSHLDTVPARLRQAIDGIVADAIAHDQLLTPRTTVAAVVVAPRRVADEALWEGSIVVDGDGFATVEDGMLTPLKVAKKNTAELRLLLELRDQAKQLLELEASTLDDTTEIDFARATLRGRYRTYAGKYGPINRYSYASNGARLTPEAPRKMLLDPFGPPVLALELFDDEEQTATEAAILSGRVIAPRPLKEGTDSPAEAITLSMERHGRVELDTIAYLLGTSETDARAQLGDLVYDDPEDPDRIIPAAEYLSGNIAERLDVARAAAATDPDRYRVNVAALDKVLPAPMLPEEIEPRLAAVWIDPATHQQFFRELLRNDNLHVASPLPGTWEVTGGTRYGVLSTETWGTEQKPAHELIRSLLNQTPIKVEREIEFGDRTTKMIDPEATAAAMAKAEEIQERFAEWVWEDPERSARLVAEYNRRFNSIVLRNYDQAGDFLTFPGMVEGFSPRPHQRAAVARVVSEPAVGLFHQVGAGKAQPLYALVLTPTGFIPMGDVAPGTEVVTPSGDIAPVAGVFPQGLRDVYRLTFNDGTTVDADGDHLWEVQTSGARATGGPWKVLTTNQIRANLLNPNGSIKWFLPNIVPVDLGSDASRPLEPYLLGLLLGDGGLSSLSTVKFSTPDPELVQAIRDLLPAGAEMVHDNGYDWRIRGEGDRSGDHILRDAEGDLRDANVLSALHNQGASIAALARRVGVTPQTVRRWIRGTGATTRERSRNPVLNALRDLGLEGKRSEAKFIPDAYKNASIAVRHAILQGLLDTDGTVGANRTSGGSSVSIVSASPRLAADVSWLVRSLGGRAVQRTIQKSYRRADGSFFTGEYTQVSVTLPNDRAPFRLPRKAERVPYRSHYRQHRLGIRSIEYLATEPTQCIRVDHPSHMYITDNFTATHNTAEMVMGAMELKRMGLVNKPAVVVPNHMLKQFAREWLQIYPQARILAAGTADLEKDKRRLFVARAAANDWDAVILTQTAFQSLPLSPAATERYIRTELFAYNQALLAAQEAGLEGTSVKKIQKAIASRTEALKSQSAITRDAGIGFEQTGIDYLFVDEAHLYKSLFTPTSLDVAPNPSKKATDLHMKLGLLRERNGDRVGTLATATPLANSIVEAFTMQRYLRPDLLHAAGIRTFDEWAATFATVASDVEVDVAGRLKMKSRLAKFQNVPEMLRMWHVSADVKTQEDLNLPVPTLVPREDGKNLAATHTITPSAQLVQFFQHLAVRADKAKGHRPQEGADNMLAIATDGRKAAVDAQLAGLPADTNWVTKADVIAEKVYGIWERTRDREYANTETGETSPIKGALQLVFSDYGTPNSDGTYSIYEDLRQKLVDRGMDASSIRFMHEARNDREKDQLFTAARAGHIAVLIGSTEKMGMGTNVQARAIALHHVDCPWRPADVEQREGRVIRQGNQNAEVEIHRYVVERSFDAFMWQTVERKARFIAQVMRGSLDAREIEDVGDAAISAAETKAIATGNPLLLDQVQTNDELQKLRRLERVHNRSQSNLVRSREYAQRRAIMLRRDITDLERAATHVVNIAGEQFAIEVNSNGGYGRSWNRYTKRSDAAHAIGQWAAQSRIAYRSTTVRIGEIAKIGAFTVEAQLLTVPGSTDATVKFTIDGIPGAEATATRNDVLTGSIGVVTRIENLQASIPTLRERTRELLADNELNLTDAEKRIGQPFKHAALLAEAQERADAIAKQLIELERAEDTPAASPPAVLRAQIQDDAWWRERPASDVRELINAARHASDQDTDAATLYQELGTQVRNRYPSAVAQHLGLAPGINERTRRDPQRATGPAVPSYEANLPSLQ